MVPTPTKEETYDMRAVNESVEIDETQFRLSGIDTTPTTTRDENNNDDKDDDKSVVDRSDDSDNESTTRTSCGSSFYIRKEFFFSMLSNMFFLTASTLYVLMAIRHVEGEEQMDKLGDEAEDMVTDYPGDDDWFFYNTYYNDTGTNYTDDNLPMLKGTGKYISIYQTEYFFAAICFTTSGLIEFIRERSLLNFNYLIAGGLGMASSVIMRNNPRLSTIFSCVSMHLWCVEAVGIFFRNYFLMHNRFCIKFLIMFANICWVIGTLLDLVFSYLFVFEKSSIEIAYASIFSASMWFVCPLLYSIATIWDECESSKKYKAGIATVQENDSLRKDTSNSSNDEENFIDK
mmetsp:Transcript_30725/g.35027  ORF Transcript_30725/g.35027 Transcript_30725/m.35027 type:complete len:345 (-) Transcript_30725:297-1331(-)|eukprot:CAMPEP_0194147190 /NCGR_PEP_ID=MMETSP0152-20130528/22578_1 /TAXON_ID=1049557 /ORGANISM="Thalassiothrix antarctica, Strain L6-D1" /LENGTH=344 /DNA_ID=CAMNT_0038847899 /DNA_START=33 /DNA_END=1067 /DNA_ORIENTATION=-